MVKDFYTNFPVRTLAIALIGCTTPTESCDFSFICNERVIAELIPMRDFGDQALIRGSRVSG